VNDAFAVCGVERLGDLAGNEERVLEWDGSEAEAFGEGVAFDEFEDERVAVAVGFEAVDCADVRMIEGGKQLGLAAEPGNTARIGDGT
jgi:hypothetical protein